MKSEDILSSLLILIQTASLRNGRNYSGMCRKGLFFSINFFCLEYFQSHRKVAKVLQRIPLYPIPISSIINILHQEGTFVTISEPILIHYYLLKSILYSYFLSFHLMSWFSSRIPCRIQYFIQFTCFLPILQTVTVSQTFFVFDHLDNFQQCSLGIMQAVPQWGFV